MKNLKMNLNGKFVVTKYGKGIDVLNTSLVTYLQAY